jgi:hypothetical protein
MATPGLTPEQRRIVEQAGDEAVRIDDAETHEAYVLVREEVYRRLGGTVGTQQSAGESRADHPVAMHEGVRHSKEAFRRALPALLAQKSLRGQWAVYRGAEQVGIARTPEVLIRECVRRGLAHDQYYLGCIRPHGGEPEEVDPSLFEYQEFQPRR